MDQYNWVKPNHQKLTFFRLFAVLNEKWPVKASNGLKWPPNGLWYQCDVLKKFLKSSVIFYLITVKSSYICPISCFGLKTASNDLGGQIWPQLVPIIWSQGTIFVLWYTPRLCFPLWSFQLLMEKWPLMTSKWPQRPVWCLRDLLKSILIFYLTTVKKFSFLAHFHVLASKRPQTTSEVRSDLIWSL